MSSVSTLPSESNPHPLIQQAGLEQEYPFVSHYLTLNGHQYHYVDEGTGPVLLFVHGNPTWSFAWRNLIKALSPHYRCIAVDHMGCGLSDKPQKYLYQLAEHIQNLQTLVETLDLQQITLIAHDWGGAIGCGVAGRLPERFERLVLMNTAAFRSQRIPLRIAACRIPLLGTLGIRGLNLFAGTATFMAVDQTKLSPKVKKGFLLPYNNWQNRVAVNQFVKDIPLNLRHPSYSTLVEVEQNLSRLQQKPVLLPWGMKDWCFSPHFLKEFQGFFPQAETHPFEWAGHYLFEEVPDELASLIQQFLQK